ncbi:MAG: carboxylating nicotinate-nucleotide diphosphorylase [Pseudohongiellaceae bacterium]
MNKPVSVNALPDDIGDVVSRALLEDTGSGDISAELIEPGVTCDAVILSRQSAVICGIPWADRVFRQLDADIRVNWLVQDGDAISPDQAVARISGQARSLLTGERSALNFLQTLSGTATLSRELANKVKHTAVRLLDTRKTLPGLRTAQKYAVRIGGCHNHRMGLFDAFLIKENHIRVCGSIGEAVARARRNHPDKPVEVEVENTDQLKEALAAGPDTVLLDNFSLAALHEAVRLSAGRTQLEASGGVDRTSLVAIAETGVDFISIGALTKNCKAVDLSMLFDQG